MAREKIGFIQFVLGFLGLAAMTVCTVLQIPDDPSMFYRLMLTIMGLPVMYVWHCYMAHAVRNMRGDQILSKYLLYRWTANWPLMPRPNNTNND